MSSTVNFPLPPSASATKMDEARAYQHDSLALHTDVPPLSYKMDAQGLEIWERAKLSMYEHHCHLDQTITDILQCLLSKKPSYFTRASFWIDDSNYLIVSVQRGKEALVLLTIMPSGTLVYSSILDGKRETNTSSLEGVLSYDHLAYALQRVSGNA